MRRPSSAGPFARQGLLPGWDQQRIENARVLIAGIGALGNACAATLALTGFRRFVLVDFDTIETSNLSRTLLFRRKDRGHKKVDVAARRLRQLILADAPAVVPLHADVVWGLGWGVYRRTDVILGCVDSAEARAWVGAPAWGLGVPAIFGGIHGFDCGVMLQGAGRGPCIACSFAAQEWRELGRRYSCDRVNRDAATRAEIPATQVAASLAAAVMAKEACDLVQGSPTSPGSRIFAAGPWPRLDRCTVGRDPRCPFHWDLATVCEAPELSHRVSAREALEILAHRFGEEVEIDLGREFITASRCKACGTPIQQYRPRHAIFERDFVCSTCQRTKHPVTKDPQPTGIRTLSEGTEPRLLDLTLEELGVPALHILEVRTPKGSRRIELSGDLEHTLPNWPSA